MTDVIFRGWDRRGAGSITANDAAGRPIVTLHINADDSTGDSEQVPVDVALYGPGDVAGLRKGAIVATYPRDGQIGVETTHCPWVQFSAPDLAWRYSPAPSAPGQIAPWLALLVVRDDPTEFVWHQGRARVTATGISFQRAGDDTHDPGAGHVQGDAGDPQAFCRVLSRRQLIADTEYRALLVPAFAADGGPSWTAAGATLPVFHHWRFRTGAAGDFATLAKQLRAADDQAQIGTISVALDDGLSVAVRGALTGTKPFAYDPPDEAVSKRLVELTTFDPTGDDGLDEDKRRYVRPPSYGEAWRLPGAPTDEWETEVDVDPIHRIAAGVGRRAGVELQDEISAAAAARYGAAAAANQRLGALVLGLAATERLWRRVPGDVDARVRLLGLGAGAIRTVDAAADPDDPGAPQRTLLAIATAPDRTLPAALFSSAALRFLRPNAGRFRRAQEGATRLLDVANRERPADDDPAGGEPFIGELVDSLIRGGVEDRESVSPGVTRALSDRGERIPRREVDLGELRDALDRAFDPGIDPPARRRVRATIWPDDGTDAPREPEIDLDLPAWRHLRERHRDWLFPGAHTLDEGEVVGLSTNPIFVDGLILGLNTAALGELRWRNIGVASGATPLRRFWDRAPIGGGDGCDVVTVGDWVGALGDASHGVGRRRQLVVAFRTDLFRRYPGTMVYLARPTAGWADADTSASGRQQPVFSARITPTLVLYAFDEAPENLEKWWVVVEQQPPGIRFELAKDPGSGDGGARAAKMLVRPVRVLLAGHTLVGAP